jgi:hypothetical protein
MATSVSMIIPGVNVPLGIGNHVIYGGGIKGLMPKPLQLGWRDNEHFVIPRKVLSQSWNNDYPCQLAKAGTKAAQTPFRMVNNSGDLLSRQNYSCGGGPQGQSVKGVRGLGSLFGGNNERCDGTGIPPATCNTRFVADSSDYNTFRILQAINRNKNDISGGGNLNSAQQSAWRAARR